MGLLYKIQNRIAKYLRIPNSELSICINHFRYPKPNTKRVIIFSQGRSGSTLLEDLLASTGYFQDYGELLSIDSKSEIKYPYFYLSGLSKPTENITCHIKIYQLLQNRKNKINPNRLLRKLYRDGWSIIFLDREDKFRQALSSEIADERKEYHKYDDLKEKIRLKIDCKKLKSNILGRIDWRKEELKALDGINYLYINYEKDLENSNLQQTTIDKILNYVNLPKKKAYTKHRKINSYGLAELIENFEEVEKLFSEFSIKESNSS